MREFARIGAMAGSFTGKEKGGEELGNGRDGGETAVCWGGETGNPEEGRRSRQLLCAAGRDAIRLKDVWW